MENEALVLIELGALLLGIALLGRLASRIGISPIPLILLGGLAFGDGGLFPISQGERFIEVGADIGVILLLVMLGLEYTAGELVTNLRTSVYAGALWTWCSTPCPACCWRCCWAGGRWAPSCLAE